MRTQKRSWYAFAIAAACIAVTVMISGCVSVRVAKAAPPVDPKLARYEAEANVIAENLKTFDTLDYEVFTGQQWARLHESHSKDVIVHWPDGHETVGLEKHIEDLKAMFVYAGDTRIKVHTVKLGSGEWTAVIGIMEGTFTKPMPTADGKMIEPTGKPYKITMCTVGHWKNGVMNEEYLFWDNLTFMKQIGIAP